MPKKTQESPKAEVKPKAKIKNIVAVHRNETDNDLYTAVFDDGSTENKYVGDIASLNEAFAREDWQSVSLKVWNNA